MNKSKTLEMSTFISKIKSWIFENKAFVFFILTVCLLVIIESFFHPKVVFIIEKRLSQIIEDESIPLTFEKVDYGFLPPRVIIKDALYKESKNTKNVIYIKKASLAPKILPLIKLKLVPNTLVLDQLDVTWTLNTKKNSQTPLSSSSLLDSIKLDFKTIIKNIFLNRIQIKKGNINLSQKKSQVQIQDLNLNLQKTSRIIKIVLSGNTQINHKGFLENFGINFDTTIDEKSFYIKYFNLQKENSILKASGALKTKEVLKNLNSKLNLNSIYNQLSEISVDIKISLENFNESLKQITKTQNNFSGQTYATVYFNNEHAEQKINISFSANKIQGAGFSLEKTKLGLSVSSDTLLVKKGSFVSFNEGSTFEIEQGDAKKINNAYWSKFKLKSKRFLLEDLLNNFGIPLGTIHSPISTDFECRGLIIPKIALRCKGDLEIKKFLLTLEKKLFLDVNKLTSPFQLNIGDKELSFSSEPLYRNKKNEDFKGEVIGNVHYKDGFIIDYNSDRFDLEFFNSIAGQTLSGIITMNGKTKGSSKWGQFIANITNGNNLIFNNFYLGKTNAKVKYTYPYLSITDVYGSIIEDQNYSANFDLDTQSNIMNLSINSTNFSNLAISKIFERSFEFPKKIKFQKGDFNLKISGDPEIAKSNLNLNAKISPFYAFGENFKQVNIDLRGQNGSWSFKDSFLKKKSSLFTVEGKILGFEDINLTLKSLDLKLEEIDTFKNAGVKLKGPCIFRLEAIGPIDKPKAVGRVQLKSTRGLKNANLGNSDIGFRLLEDQINFKGEGFNQKIVGSGSYPISKKGQLGFNGTVSGLDLFHISNFAFDNSSVHSLPLAFSSNVSIFRSYKNFIVSGWLDELNAEFTNATKKLFEVKSLETIQFDKEDSSLLIRSSEVHEANLKIISKNSDPLKMRINGRFESSGLQAFIPKTEILNGLMDFDNVVLKIKENEIKHYGKINFSNGTFKTTSFPYSFTDIGSVFYLKDNKISFDKIDARINNKPISASGFITTLPFSLQAQLKYKDLKIEYPDDIFSLSDGDLIVSGSGLPLKTAGRIHIKAGEFKQDLLTNTDKKTITANKFLPQKILYENTPPFDLDLWIKIDDNYIIKTHEINGFAKGQLYLEGNAFNPFTRGKIQIKQGMTINFLDKVFTVKEGYLSYSNTYIDNPNLYIDAVTEVLDNNNIGGNNYLIRMLVEGSAQNLKFSFNSTPSLSEKEIISLITLGTISTQSVGQEINTEQQATHSGLQVGSFLLQKNKGIQELQKKTGTEIGLVSSVDAFNVNPKVQLKKKWSPKLSSTVSQSFGNQQILSLSTEYQVTGKVSTSFTIQNNQTQDATQLQSRQIQQGQILGIGLQYKFEFD